MHYRYLILQYTYYASNTKFKPKCIPHRVILLATGYQNDIPFLYPESLIQSVHHGLIQMLCYGSRPRAAILDFQNCMPLKNKNSGKSIIKFYCFETIEGKCRLKVIFHLKIKLRRLINCRWIFNVGYIISVTMLQCH